MFLCKYVCVCECSITHFTPSCPPMKWARDPIVLCVRQGKHRVHSETQTCIWQVHTKQEIIQHTSTQYVYVGGMCVCYHVCMFNVSYICIHKRTYIIPTYTYIHMLHTQTHIDVHTIHIHTHTYIHRNICTDMTLFYSSQYTYIIHKRTYILPTYTCIHIHTYKHMYIHSQDT